MRSSYLLPIALIGFSLPARAQSDLDLQAAYCLGTYQQRVDTLLPGKSEFARTTTNTLEHLKRYITSRGYYDPANSISLSHLTPAIEQGKADQAEMIRIGLESASMQCAMKCNQANQKQFSICFADRCKPLQTDRERRVFQCTHIERDLPF